MSSYASVDGTRTTQKRDPSEYSGRERKPHGPSLLDLAEGRERVGNSAMGSQETQPQQLQQQQQQKEHQV